MPVTPLRVVAEWAPYRQYCCYFVLAIVVIGVVVAFFVFFIVTDVVVASPLWRRGRTPFYGNWVDRASLSGIPPFSRLLEIVFFSDVYVYPATRALLQRVTYTMRLQCDACITADVDDGGFSKVRIEAKHFMIQLGMKNLKYCQH